LLVLMRPTVMRTPEIAAAQTKTEEARLPGISSAESEEKWETHKAELQEQRQERIRLRRESLERAHPSDATAASPVSTGDPLGPDPMNQPQYQPETKPASPSASGDNLFQPVPPGSSAGTNVITYPSH